MTSTYDLSFWFIILALNLSSFLVLLEGTIISNALPTIADALDGAGSLWIGSAYNLAAAAFMPAAGGLAQAFGRKPVILGSLVIFSLGSTLCGIAKSMGLLIAGRVVQGLGGAGVFTSCAIILSDIVPLSNRGVFNGINQMTWCLASAIGPAIGGLLASKGYWRWIFFVNLPMAVPAMVIIVAFLHLKTPHKKRSDAFRQTDWIGIILIALSSISVSVALVCGGVNYKWTSWRIILPLVLGGAGFICLILYEVFLVKYPLIPIQVMKNRTTLSGYAQIFIVPIPFMAVIFYMPLYFQACKSFSEATSGLALFGVAVTTPLSSVLTGLAIKATQRYRPQIWAGWVLMIIGLVLLSIVQEDTPVTLVIFYEVLAGIGFGVQFAALYFPVLAPLPVTSSAPALAFFTFMRMFSQIWGINMGGTILQSSLGRRLESTDLTFWGGEIVQLIPLMTGLEGQALLDVRHAFVRGLATLWHVMAGVSGLGLLASLFMRHVDLPTAVDSDWGMKERSGARNDLESPRSSGSQTISNSSK